MEVSGHRQFWVLELWRKGCECPFSRKSGGHQVWCGCFGELEKFVFSTWSETTGVQSSSLWPGQYMASTLLTAHTIWYKTVTHLWCGYVRVYLINRTSVLSLVCASLQAIILPCRIWYQHHIMYIINNLIIRSAIDLQACCEQVDVAYFCMLHVNLMINMAFAWFKLQTVMEEAKTYITVAFLTIKWIISGWVYCLCDTG